MKTIAQWAASAAMFCLLVSTAGAQAYPTRPVTLIVPYAAGGGADAAARLVANELGKAIGQTIVIENKAGASTMLAAEYVARAANDGYTLLFGATTTFAVNPHLYKNIRYQASDFEPVGDLVTLPFVFVAGKKLPVTDIKGLVEYARKNPGKISYGTFGAGSVSHVLGEMLSIGAGIKMTAVPYRGSGPAATDVIAGTLDAYIDGITTTITHHKAGTYKVIGSFGKTRSKALPDVPTFIEAGYPSVTGTTVFSVFAPKGTSTEIVSKLHQATVTVVANAELKARFEALGGATESSSSPAAMKQRLAEESQHWGSVIKEMKIELQ